MKWTKTGMFLALSMVGTFGSAPGQEGQEPQEEPKPPIQPRLSDLGIGEQPSPQEEMINLFRDVEERMADIGSLLLDASAGDTTRLEDLQGSGMEDLLKDEEGTPQSTGGIADLLNASQRSGQQVLNDIDRILQIAAQNGGTASGAMSQDGKPPEQPGGDQQPGEQSGQKEPTPDGLDPQGRQPSQQEPEGQEPTGNQDNPPESPEGTANQAPGSEAGNPLHAGPGGEQWGNLPIHLRELFRAEGGEQLPPRYRDWIDTYYRRLNRRADD